MPTLASRHLITVWVFIGLNGSWAYISLCDILILLPFVGLLRITLDIYCIALYNKHIKTINNKGRNKMNISKTTTNFAEARGLSVYIDEDTSILWMS